MHDQWAAGGALVHEASTVHELPSPTARLRYGSAVLIALACAAALFLAALWWAGSSMKTEHAALIVFGATLTLRPATLGEVFGPIGSVALGALLLLVLRNRQDAKVLPPAAVMAGLFVAVVFPLAAARSIDAALLSGLISYPIVAWAGIAVGRDERLRRQLTRLYFLMAVHQTVAFVLSQLLPVPVMELTPPIGRDRAGWVYEISLFGSVTAGSGGVFPGLGPRLTGPFGEPGLMAAMMAIAAGLDVWARGGVRWTSQVFFFGAVILTQSVAGIASYVAMMTTFLVLKRLRSKRLGVRHYALIFVIVTACLRAAAADDSVLLAAKADANAHSVEDRLGGASPSAVLDSWLKHPFGLPDASVGSGINLARAAMTYGPIVTFACFALYLGCLRGRYWRDVAPTVAALFLTVVFAQPPLLYSWVFLAFVLGTGSKVGSAAALVRDTSPARSISAPNPIAFARGLRRSQ